MSKPEDSQQREQSLDISRSFIVQAPAGSGKTSLLTQRYLRLLARVQQPEEILAITFTRKAAAEMHERIMGSLQLALQARPSDAFDAQTWDIAREVLQHDQLNEWHLLQTPNRLRVQTIDALCSNLTQQLPVTSRFGSPPSIQTDSSPLYIEAARHCLAELDADDEVAEAIKRLLLHVDNQLSRAEQLIASMLASRDQWMRHLTSDQPERFSRETLEEVLQRSIESVLIRLVCCLSDDQRESLEALLAFAAEHIIDIDSAIYQYGDSIDLTDADASSLAAWQMLAGFLLSSTGEWRKQASAALGFPAASAANDKQQKSLFGDKKKQYKALLAELAEDEQLTELMSWLTCLPSAHYSQQQWQFVEALFIVLPRAVGHLRLVFQYHAKVDFCEVSLSASHALHDATGVTDLALRLDYQLQHILVDEFQDTSETQFSLLQDLVAGWQAGDGRSLFLVGDPMQSIYRFRQAEVGLFLKTQQDGLGEVRDIQALNISVNFRSQAGVVNWVNQVFKQVMPAHDDLYSGAISYKPSMAFKGELDDQAVCYYPHADRAAEGQALLGLIQVIQQDQPDASIGVLVRGRTALVDLVAELNQAGVAYQASDIDPLNLRPTVIDLVSLSRAYLQAADRVSWLAVLRAPWCGFSLSDMLLLVEGAAYETVWDLIHDESRTQALSTQGKQGLQHVLKVFQQAFENRERMPLSEIIYGLWGDLLGPECLSVEAELNDAQAYFNCLRELEAENQTLDIEALEARLDKLYAAPDVNASDRLQIMTIHKAKGLEFDHVILPGLDRRARHDDKRLLAWLERPSELYDDSELLISPIKETGTEDDDPIGGYLTKIEQQKSLNESQRLLYVAATRAKKQLHLSFCLSYDEKKQAVKKPASNTLLGLLWPSIADQVEMPSSEHEDALEPLMDSPRMIQRLNLKALQFNEAEYADYPPQKEPYFKQQTELLAFDLVSDMAAATGTVCHQLMQIVGEQGLDKPPSNDQLIRHLLLEAGVLPSLLEQAMSRVRLILQHCLKDKRGRWVLNNTHQDSQFEWAISGVVNREIIHARLDRSFIDEGKRWIIDYKTSQFDGEDMEQFLDQEVETYRTQLERYAQLLSQLEGRPIMLGLYYPEYAAWRSWEYRPAC